MMASVLEWPLLDRLLVIAHDCKEARWKINSECDALGPKDDGDSRERFKALSARSWRLAKIEDAIADLLGVEGAR